MSVYELVVAVVEIRLVVKEEMMRVKGRESLLTELKGAKQVTASSSSCKNLVPAVRVDLPSKWGSGVLGVPLSRPFTVLLCGAWSGVLDLSWQAYALAGEIQGGETSFTSSLNGL